MKCKDPNLVVDIHPYNTETFGIRCGNLKQTPSFEIPPPDKWPRCIPKVCVLENGKPLEKHQVLYQTYLSGDYEIVCEAVKKI